jgi:hypothetical protein
MITAVMTKTSTTVKTPTTRARHEPPVVTVYKGETGIHHARCGQRIEFRGSRMGLELEFYCRVCHEHVTLPDHVLARIPPGPPLAV